MMNAVAGRYSKERIALRRPLTAFNISGLKSFETKALPDHFPSPTEDTGTQDAMLLALRGVTPDIKDHPLSLLVTYYSDPEDKVPHTPDVCYRQGGTIVHSITTTEVDVAGLEAGQSPITACVLDIEQPHARGIVLYVFCANGEFYHDREQLRWRIGRPGDRYIYFSKIEVNAPYVTEAEKQRALIGCKKLLGESLTLLVNDHFPSRESLNPKQ